MLVAASELLLNFFCADFLAASASCMTHLMLVYDAYSNQHTFVSSFATVDFHYVQYKHVVTVLLLHAPSGLDPEQQQSTSFCGVRKVLVL